MKKKLIPPGTILYEEFMEPLGITAYKLSKGIKVQQTAIGQIIRGGRRITVDMALRLSRYFGNSAQFWLNLQNYYDLESETEKKAYLFKEIVPYSPLDKRAQQGVDQQSQHSVGSGKASVCRKRREGFSPSSSQVAEKVRPYASV